MMGSVSKNLDRMIISPSAFKSINDTDDDPIQELENEDGDGNVEKYDSNIPYCDRIVKRFNSPALINHPKYKRLKNLIYFYYKNKSHLE